MLMLNVFELFICISEIGPRKWMNEWIIWGWECGINWAVRQMTEYLCNTFWILELGAIKCNHWLLYDYGGWLSTSIALPPWLALPLAVLRFVAWVGCSVAFRERGPSVTVSVMIVPHSLIEFSLNFLLLILCAVYLDIPGYTWATIHKYVDLFIPLSIYICICSVASIDTADRSWHGSHCL